MSDNEISTDATKKPHNKESLKLRLTAQMGGEKFLR